MLFHEIEFGFLFPSSLKLCTSNLWNQPNVKETISQELVGFSFCNSSFFFPFTGVIGPLSTMSLVLAHGHSLTMAELGLRADDSTSSHCFCSAGLALALQNLLLDCVSPHLSRSVLVLSGPNHLQSSKPRLSSVLPGIFPWPECRDWFLLWISLVSLITLVIQHLAWDTL